MDRTSVKEWLERLSAKVPVPGGGAVAALAAAISAAQLGMVSAYTTGPKWQDREAEMQSFNDELSSLREQAILLMSKDAEAFTNVRTAYNLPRTTDKEKAERHEVIQRSLAVAAEPPRQTTELALRLTDIAEKLVTICNPNVISDVAVAVSMTRAALESAIVNIEINKQQLEDAGTTRKLQSAIQESEAAMQKADEIVSAVRKRIGTTAP